MKAQTDVVYERGVGGRIITIVNVDSYTQDDDLDGLWVEYTREGKQQRKFIPRHRIVCINNGEVTDGS